MRALLLCLSSVVFAWPGAVIAEELETDVPAVTARHELTLYPASLQVNGHVENSFGGSLGYVFHLHERAGLAVRLSQRLTGIGVAQPEVSGMTQETMPIAERLVATSLRAGSELMPFTGAGKLVGQDVELGVTVFGGVGIDHVLHLLDARSYEKQFLFDAGWLPGAEVALGGRVLLWHWFALRLEAAESVAWGRETKLNGCDASSIIAMDNALRAGRSITGAQMNDTCDSAFYEADQLRVPIARSIFRAEPSSSLLNTVTLRLGVSAAF